MSFNSIDEIKPQPGKQELVFSLLGKVDFMLCGGSRYGGKVAPNDSWVQTPFGKKLNGNLKVGDIILNPEGCRQTVLAIHPHKDWDFYKITFADGTTYEAGLEHFFVAWKGNHSGKKKRRLVKQGHVDDHTSLFPQHAEKVNVETLRKWLSQGYYPHIPVTKPVTYERNTNKDYIPDAYVLGHLLGDGCISTRGITVHRHQDDNEIDEYYREAGFKLSKERGCGFYLMSCLEKDKLLNYLERVKLLGTKSDTKFIPQEYLFSSIEVRTALLQGLMDTDGTVSPDAKLYYATTSEQLANDVKHLVQSLGGLATITTDIGAYRDKEGNKVECKKCYTLYIRLHHTIKPFRLKRKSDRYSIRPVKRLYRTITSIEYSRNCDGRCITVSHPNSLYLADEFVVTHNTNLAVMMSLAFQHDPNYRGIYFRKQSDQLIGGGSIDEYCKSMYTHYDAKRVGKPNICYTFPSRATVELRHMYNSDDYEKHRGKSYSAVFFDEIDQFDKHEVEFLMTCLRSNADMNSFCVGTCNPSQSWVKPLVEWYLDETGIPDDSKVGVIRYFIVKDGEFIFGDDEQYFLDNYHDSVFIVNDKGESLYVPPKTFTFVFFNIYDNPIGLKRNPRYLSELKNKPDWQVRAELFGDWNSTPQQSQFWKREWVRGEKGERVKDLKSVPSMDSCITMRGVDKAHSEPSEVYKYPDYTAWSPQFRKTREGLYYMVGNYHPSIKDPIRPGDRSPVTGRVRMLAGERDAMIVKQAVYDGRDCQVVLARDKGAGAQDFRYTVAKVMAAEDEFGRPARLRVVQDQTQSNQADKKVKDFEPFCNACQQGLVYIVEDTFDKDTLELFYKELESFDGTKSGGATKRDDWVDAVSMTFNAICAAGKPYRTLGNHQVESRSLAYDILQK